MNKIFEFSEEKINNDEVVKVLKQIDNHHVQILEKVEKIDRSISQVIGAFPEMDYEGHKRYHQTMIDILNERRALRVAIQQKTISGLIWSIIVGICLALWHELLRLLGRGSL